MTEEIWKDIPNFDDYQVSNLGRVKSFKRKKPIILKGGINQGYPYVLLRNQGESVARRVHRLVLSAFVGPCPDGMESCHNNDIKNDNRLENLRYDTHKNNLEDSIKNNDGVMKHAKLTLEQVKEVKSLLSHRPVQEIADTFDVSLSVIIAIKNSKAYKHIKGGTPNVSGFQRYKDRATEIRKLYSTGNYKYQDLAGMFGLTISGVSRIINHQRASDEDEVYPIRDKEGKFLASTKPVRLKTDLWERLEKSVRNKQDISFILSQLAEMWLDDKIEIVVSPQKEK